MRRLVFIISLSIDGYRIQKGSIRSKASATLKKNGSWQGQVYFTTSDTNLHYITMSQSVILQCNAGDKVWVESTTPNNFIYGYTNQNVFADVLLSMN